MFNSMSDVKKFVDEKVVEHLSDKNVTVEYSNRLTSTLGRCKYYTFLNKYTLQFNLKYFQNNYNNGNVVRNTILHEIAHAMVGNKHNHDRVWQNACLSIGGNGKRLAKRSEIKGVQTLKERAKYKVVCENCGSVNYRVRECGVTLYPNLYRCTCCGVSNFKVIKLKW